MLKKSLIMGLMLMLCASLYAQENLKDATYTLTANVPAIFSVNHKIVNARTDAQAMSVEVTLPPKIAVLVKVEAKGYQPQWRMLDPTAGEIKEETFTLEPLLVPCLFTSPNGKIATLYLRGREIGQTPCYAFLEAGKTHSLKADAEGYHPETIVINTIDGRAKYLSVNLKPSSATLVLNTIPEGASVTVNGISYGETPRVRNKLQPGQYRILFSEEGYKDMEMVVEIAEGEEKEVAVTLEPLEASLRVATIPEDARVYIDGIYHGQSNLLLNDLEASAISVSVEKVGYMKESRPLVLSSGEESFVEFRLEKVLSTATFTLSPAEVDIAINRKHKLTTTPSKKGSYISAPVELELPIGKHKLTFSAKHYFDKEIEIILQENKPLNLGQIALEFKPNMKVTLKTGTVYKGALIEETNETLRIMTRPGTIIPVPIRNIETRERINVPTFN